MSDVSARAAAAKRLMEDPLLVEALANVRKAAVTQWASTKAEDVQGREFAWLTVKAVDRIEAELQSIITDGAMAARRVLAPVR